ncbi:MAG: hypothetical protein M3459_04590, partial [Actinomycetota bacterium]|nr:hypothetical protein [Actinomycetota bacterium]
MILDPATEAAPALSGPARNADPVLLRPAERASARRDTVRRRALAAADLCALAGAFLVMLVVVAPEVNVVEAWMLLLALPAWLLLHKALGLYDRDCHLLHKSTLDEVPTIVESVTLGTALLFLFGPFVPGADFDRAEAVGFLAAAVVTVPLLRTCV